MLTAPKTGAILHSAEGRFVPGNSPPEIMVSRGVSWQFSVYENGKVEQHYEIEDICWHSGKRPSNTSQVGIEHEGTAALTPAQFSASFNLVLWLSQTVGFPMDRTALHEHNEFTVTTCPSGRIPWERYTAPPVVQEQQEEEVPEYLTRDEYVVIYTAQEKYLHELTERIVTLENKVGQTPDATALAHLQDLRKELEEAAATLPRGD